MVFDKDLARETLCGSVDKRVALAGFFIGVQLQNLTEEPFHRTHERKEG